MEYESAFEDALYMIGELYFQKRRLLIEKEKVEVELGQATTQLMEYELKENEQKERVGDDD